MKIKKTYIIKKRLMKSLFLAILFLICTMIITGFGIYHEWYIPVSSYKNISAIIFLIWAINIIPIIYVYGAIIQIILMKKTHQKKQTLDQKFDLFN